MRYTFAMRSAAMAFLLSTAAGASAQMEARAENASSTPEECANQSGRFLQACLDRASKKAAKDKKSGSAAGPATKGTKGLSKADAELVNSTNTSGQAKLAANDFAGAAADFQKGIDASPNNPAKHILYGGLGMSLRRQAIATYNSGTRPTPPGVGATSDQIRAFNAAALAARKEQTAVAMPLLTRAIEASATAAAGADASENKAADQMIGIEMREDAHLFFQLDPAATLATPRPSIDVEVTWLRRWLTATPPPAQADIGKYGFAVAAALSAKDRAVGLALADEIQGQAGAGIDQALDYAEIVAAAKTPAGDPHRAKALAGIAAIEGTLVDGSKRAQAARLKTALGS